MVKITHYIISSALLILLLAACESDIDTTENKTPVNDQIVFTAINSKAANATKNLSGNRNLQKVPDTVGVFVRKTDGTPELIMENAFYRKTNYESDNYLSTDGEIKTDIPGGEQLFWYKTLHKAAYWTKKSGVTYDFFAYAPAVETNEKNGYYNIDENGIVSFEMDGKVGIPVDFIYARRTDRSIAQADSLHMPFKHMLSKIVFRLKNTTGNGVVCYGVKYKIRYPIANFNLITGKWSFDEINTQPVEVNRYAQYEIFSGTEVELSELTTLLFPTHTANTADGTVIGNVVVDFQVCLNNKWYDMTTKIRELKLEYIEGRLIELTFDCQLDYGDGNHPDWNIFVATFDSFEEGDPINGILK